MLQTVNQDIFLPRGIDHEHFLNTPNTDIFNPNPGKGNHGVGERFDPNDDAKAIAFLEANYHQFPKKLEDGSWCALFKLATTWSVCTDITYHTSYAYRWCFRDKDEALYFLENIKEFDEVPTRRTSLVGHRFDRYARLASWDHEGKKRW